MTKFKVGDEVSFNIEDYETYGKIVFIDSEGEYPQIPFLVCIDPDHFSGDKIVLEEFHTYSSLRADWNDFQTRKKFPKGLDKFNRYQWYDGDSLELITDCARVEILIQDINNELSE